MIIIIIAVSMIKMYYGCRIDLYKKNNDNDSMKQQKTTKMLGDGTI